MFNDKRPNFLPFIMKLTRESSLSTPTELCSQDSGQWSKQEDETKVIYFIYEAKILEKLVKSCDLLNNSKTSNIWICVFEYLQLSNCNSKKRIKKKITNLKFKKRHSYWFIMNTKFQTKQNEKLTLFVNFIN